MLAVAGVIYSALMSFILSAASQNRRLGRPHAPMLLYVGYCLAGISAASAALLPLWAATKPEAVGAVLKLGSAL